MVNEVKVTYKRLTSDSCQTIRKPSDAAELLRSTWEDDIDYIERFKVVLLNRANKVVGIHLVSQGGISGTVVDPKVVFVAAIKCGASAIILAHNHPSGNLSPSGADLQLTDKLKEGGEYLSINVLDHIILTSEGHKALSEEGIL